MPKFIVAVILLNLLLQSERFGFETKQVLTCLCLFKITSRCQYTSISLTFDDALISLFRRIPLWGWTAVQLVFNYFLFLVKFLRLRFDRGISMINNLLKLF
jgi:hypothetical protein